MNGAIPMMLHTNDILVQVAKVVLRDFWLEQCIDHQPLILPTSRQLSPSSAHNRFATVGNSLVWVSEHVIKPSEILWAAFWAWVMK
jgi:hypothetical protein